MAWRTQAARDGAKEGGADGPVLMGAIHCVVPHCICCAPYIDELLLERYGAPGCLFKSQCCASVRRQDWPPRMLADGEV